MQIIYSNDKAQEILALLSTGKIEKLHVFKDTTNEVYVINYIANEELNKVNTKAYSIFKEFIDNMENNTVVNFNLNYSLSEFSCSKSYKEAKKQDDKAYTSEELKQLLIDQLTKEGKIDELVDVYNRVQGSGKQKKYIQMTVKEVLERV